MVYRPEGVKMNRLIQGAAVIGMLLAGSRASAAGCPGKLESASR